MKCVGCLPGDGARAVDLSDKTSARLADDAVFIDIDERDADRRLGNCDCSRDAGVDKPIVASREGRLSLKLNCELAEKKSRPKKPRDPF